MRFPSKAAATTTTVAPERITLRDKASGVLYIFLFLILSAAKRASRIEASGFYDNPSTHPSRAAAAAAVRWPGLGKQVRLFLSITLVPGPVKIISFTCFAGFDQCNRAHRRSGLSYRSDVTRALGFRAFYGGFG